MLQNVPNWLGAAVIGALITTLSFTAKTFYEWWLKIRAVRAARLASILHLASLLRASWVIFSVQNGHARRLLESLRASHPDVAVEGRGFEQVFSKLHDRFTPEEAQLHRLIRSITENALRPTNTSILEWLRNDAVFRTAMVPLDEQKKRSLAEKLYALEGHLLLWEAKYQSWLPSEPGHALVYLADEEAHGVGFPVGIDVLIQEIILDLSKSAPRIPVHPTT
jgi:hypothetical protein